MLRTVWDNQQYLQICFKYALLIFTHIVCILLRKEIDMNCPSGSHFVFKPIFDFILVHKKFQLVSCSMLVSHKIIIEVYLTS